MKKPSLAGKWALVTGASSGIGAEFARQLAWAGTHLILTARRAEPMERLAAELKEKAKIDVRVLPCDLSLPESPALLDSRIRELGLPVDILINNAGFGIYGIFDEIPWDKEKSMLDLCITSLVEMTRIFSLGMRQRKFGLILQVSSIGAYQPTPLYASYSAAKSFVLNYGLAIHEELRKTGVSCTVLSPGVTATDFQKEAGQGQGLTLYQRTFLMRVPDVVRAGLKALFRRQSSIVPGFFNKLMVFFTRFVSRNAAAKTARWLLQ